MSMIVFYLYIYLFCLSLSQEDTTPSMPYINLMPCVNIFYLSLFCLKKK